VPYRAALLAILLANVHFVYRVARRLGAGELAAGMAARRSQHNGVREDLSVEPHVSAARAMRLIGFQAKRVAVHRRENR
jgi:hypothetical protein